MKVGTQQDDHQLGESTKTLTGQGHPSIDDITFIASALNPPYLLLHLNCQSYIDDGSESDFVYHNPPVVVENQSISSQVKKASSNGKDQVVDEETLDIFSEINSNNFVSTNTGPAISGQLAEVEKRY